MTCEPHGIAITRDKPLHSVFGEYVKALRDGSYLESAMTERILKSSISVLEAFNDVRNNKSLAHDKTQQLARIEEVAPLGVVVAPCLVGVVARPNGSFRQR